MSAHLGMWTPQVACMPQGVPAARRGKRVLGPRPHLGDYPRCVSESAFTSAASLQPPWQRAWSQTNSHPSSLLAEMFIEVELGDHHTALLPSPFLQVDAWGHFNLRRVNFVIGFKRGKRVVPVYTLPLPRAAGATLVRYGSDYFVMPTLILGAHT